MKRLQLIIGVVLAAAAFAGVLALNNLLRPPTYDVMVVIQEVPAFTELDDDMVALDAQTMSRAVAEKYVLYDEWQRLLAEGVVAVENLHPGQPLLREQVASGAEAEGLSRLAVALNDPDRVILSVPVDPNDLPSIVPGDVAALFFTAGSIRASEMTTEVVSFAGVAPTPAPTMTLQTAAVTATVTTTVRLDMPLAKWVANGVVYRLNRERRENPNYGAPGMEGEPRYIEGAVRSLDIVVRREDAEWVAFALAHGQVRVGLLPAVAREAVEAGTFPPSAGVTWTDMERRFFSERGASAP